MTHSWSVITHALLLTFLGALGTALGGLVIVFNPHGTPSFYFLGLIQGLAAGLMLSISFLDLLPQSMEVIGFPLANVCFFAGVGFFATVVTLVPEPSPTGLLDPQTMKEVKSPRIVERHDHKIDLSLTGKREQKAVRRQRVMISGLVTAVGMALHNFPEGVAVFLASQSKGGAGNRGLSLAVAIALHNIPEGVAVALPVYFATRSRWQALKLTLLSGLVEPLAVVVVGVIYPVDLSDKMVECMLAAVGGIMAFLTINELIPLALEHVGTKHTTFVVFLGMALMSLSLYWLDAVSN